MDHNLLSNLENNGVREIAKDWFFSYVTDRDQFFPISGHKALTSNFSWAVPLGSILGPFMKYR